MSKKTRKLTQLQIDELASFGYMVRSNDDREVIEEKFKEFAKADKPKTVPNSSKRDAKVIVELNLDEEMSKEDYSYLDELET
jgi:hypothetical protein